MYRKGEDVIIQYLVVISYKLVLLKTFAYFNFSVQIFGSCCISFESSAKMSENGICRVYSIDKRIGFGPITLQPLSDL